MEEKRESENVKQMNFPQRSRVCQESRVRKGSPGGDLGQEGSLCSLIFMEAITSDHGVRDLCEIQIPRTK